MDKRHVFSKLSCVHVKGLNERIGQAESIYLNWSSSGFETRNAISNLAPVDLIFPVDFCGLTTNLEIFSICYLEDDSNTSLIVNSFRLTIKLASQ